MGIWRRKSEKANYAIKKSIVEDSGKGSEDETRESIQRVKIKNYELVYLATEVSKQQTINTITTVAFGNR